MNFTNIILEDSTFLYQNIKKTRWEHSNFQRPHFNKSYLSSSEFIDCGFENTCFDTCIISESSNIKFIDCEINNSQFLTPGTLSQEFIFDKSRLIKVTFMINQLSPSQKRKLKRLKILFGTKVFDALKSNLSGSILKDCRLIETTFDRTILKKVDFTNSRIINSNFQGANLVDADLSKAIIDDKTSLKNALYSENTKFPQNFSVIEHEMKKVD